MGYHLCKSTPLPGCTGELCNSVRDTRLDRRSLAFPICRRVLPDGLENIATQGAIKHSTGGSDDGR